MSQEWRLQASPWKTLSTIIAGQVQIVAAAVLHHQGIFAGDVSAVSFCFCLTKVVYLAGNGVHGQLQVC